MPAPSRSPASGSAASGGIIFHEWTSGAGVALTAVAVRRANRALQRQPLYPIQRAIRVDGTKRHFWIVENAIISMERAFEKLPVLTLAESVYAKLQ
jgi:hypothetical protein